MFSSWLNQTLCFHHFPLHQQIIAANAKMARRHIAPSYREERARLERHAMSVARIMQYAYC